MKKKLFPIANYIINRFIESNKKELDYSLWDLKVNENGNMVIADCNCIELVKEYGTPIFVVNKDELRNNFNKFHKSFESGKIDFEIYYSYKTNPIPGILKVIHESGAGAEVISPYELWLAHKLEVEPDSIIYNGPNKTYEGLEFAIKKKIKLININSFNEIEMIKMISEKSGLKPKVGVRVNTSVGWCNQFGFSIKSGKAFKAFKRLKEIDSLDTVAIHVHLGSDIKSIKTYQTSIEEIYHLIRSLKQKLNVCIKYLDVGGGFGVSTVKGRSGIEFISQKIFSTPILPPKISATPSIETFVDCIIKTVKAQCKKYNLELPVILVEPGRAITSNAQLLLTRVGDLKITDNESRIAIVDAGINIAYPTTWEYHEIYCINKMNSENVEYYSIAGPICTPSDLYIINKRLPLLEIGDILSIMDAGAYFTSFSNNFSFPRPPVIIASKGKHQLIRDKESFEDMIRLDKI